MTPMVYAPDAFIYDRALILAWIRKPCKLQKYSVRYRWAFLLSEGLRYTHRVVNKKISTCDIALIYVYVGK